MKINPCTPPHDYRGPVRVWGRVHPGTFAWLPKDMVGLEPGDVAVFATGERVERRWVLLEGCHLRAGCPHRHVPA